MSPALTDAITRDRFRSWAKVLKEHTATPVLCIAVGHGDVVGSIELIQVDGLTRDALIGFLREALETLEGGGP